MTGDIIQNLIKYYRKTPKSGRLIAAWCFLTHGVFDAVTTAVAFTLASERGISKNAVEFNPFIPSGIPQMISVNIIGGLLIFLLIIITFRTVKFKTEYDIRTVAYPFTVVAVLGSFLVINNTIMVLRVFVS
jgi:hypothetical protein